MFYVMSKRNKYAFPISKGYSQLQCRICFFKIFIMQYLSARNSEIKRPYKYISNLPIDKSTLYCYSGKCFKNE